MDTLGQRIRKIRDMRRLTQKALASKAGISEVALQCYEIGRASCRERVYRRV